MIRIQGLETMPKTCGDCQMARLVPLSFSHYPKQVYKCFWTKETDYKDIGSKQRMDGCPLIQVDYGKQTTEKAKA